MIKDIEDLYEKTMKNRKQEERNRANEDAKKAEEDKKEVKAQEE